MDNILNSYSVKEIKIWAKDNELRCPAGLKKHDLINYLILSYNEKAKGVNKITKTITTLINDVVPMQCDPELDWLVHLHTYGWCSVPISNWKKEFTSMFFDWFESCSLNFKREDNSTWKTSNMPVMLHGILKNYFGHTELQWQIRELCAPIFSRIWGCKSEDLLSSFDGGCFLPPINKTKNGSFKQWIHNDQPRVMRDFCCVQGIVNFEENGPEDGGLVLVEGSHIIFNEYLDKHPSEGIVWAPADMNDPLISERRLIKICAPPGSLILFDSRTFHCNIHPTGSKIKEDGTLRFRMCTYVSMQPRIGASEKELTKRIRLYEKGRLTGHWCYGPWFKETPENPRLYGNTINNKPEKIEIAPLNELRSKLIGY